MRAQTSATATRCRGDDGVHGCRRGRDALGETGLQDSRTDAQTRTDGLDGSQQQLELGRGLGLAGGPLI
jgi:hypothetical protein